MFRAVFRIEDWWLGLGHFQVGSYGDLIEALYIPYGSLIEALYTLNSPPLVSFHWGSGLSVGVWV